MLRPLPYPDANRIVVLTEANQRGQTMSVSWPDYQDWASQVHAFDAFGLYRSVSVNLAGRDHAERLSASVASSGIFGVSGIPPLAGRAFGSAEDAPTTARVALLSERLWRSQFGARDDVIGNSILLDAERYTVIGIMPATMRFPSRLTDIWLPLGLSIGSFPQDRGTHPGLIVAARLKPAVTIDAARAEMRGIAQRLADQYPDSNRGVGIAVNSFLEQVFESIRPAFLLLLAAVGLVLLMACANLTSLLLAQGEARRREMAVRAALGAGRSRLARQLLTEAVVLSLGGGALGSVLAVWGIRAFTASGPTSVPRADLIHVDWSVLGFAATISVATGLALGVVPALRTSFADLHSTLKDGARRIGGGVTRLRSVLVIGQIAMALTLLVGAGLFMKSFAHVVSVDLGFDPAHVVGMRLALPTVKYDSVERWTEFHRALLAELSATPGVEAAGINSTLPLEGGGSESFVLREGDPMPGPDHPPAMCSFQISSPGLFRALGVRLVRGRLFDDRDAGGAPRVVIVDDILARTLFGSADPIGRRVAFEGTGHRTADFNPSVREIVGVVHHVVHYGLTSEPPYLQLFVPYTQLPSYLVDRRPTMTVLVRTALPAESAVSEVRDAVSRIDRDVPVYGAKPLAQNVSEASEQVRLSTAVLVAFAALALALAAVGVYGVLSYAVSLRTREIGVRVALGANRGAVARLVTVHAAKLIGSGLLLGLAGALLLSRGVSSQLYGVSALDPGTLAAVVAVLAFTAAVATYLPARRASTVDPLVALRNE